MTAVEGGDPTGGGLLVVIILLLSVFAKQFMKKTPLPFTLIILLFGVIVGVLFSTGTCSEDADSCNDHSAHSNTTAYEESHTNTAFCANQELMGVRYRCLAQPCCKWENRFIPQDGFGVLLHSLDLWTSLDPHLTLYTFLPALIYSSASSMNVHIFWKSKSQIFTLAGPGVLIATFLTATLIQVFQPSGYDWSWWSAATLGAMLSATDPVAVVALLRDVNAPSNLGTIIEGESLFNDGTAFVLFLICYEAIQGEARDLPESIIFFFRLAGGGVVLGGIAGALMTRYIGHSHDAVAEVIVTVAFAYGSFMLAEMCHVSGVLAVVVLGLEMARVGKPLLTDEHMMHHFWELMEFIANCIVFMLCGLQIAAATSAFLSGADFATDLGFMAIVYLIIMVVRTFTITILAPLFCYSGYGVNLREGTVIAWAGLRGAVSLMIASMVATTNPVDLDCGVIFMSGCAVHGGNSTVADMGIDANEVQVRVFQGRILFHCAGVTFLTLIVNGMSTGRMVKYFKLGLQTRATQQAFDRACQKLTKQCELRLKELSSHKLYAHVDHDLVYDLLPIFNDEQLMDRFKMGKISAARFKMINTSKHFREQRGQYNLSGVEPLSRKKQNQDKLPAEAYDRVVKNPSEFAGFVRDHWLQLLEARRRGISMLESIYWHQYEQGWTSETSITSLTEVVAMAMDQQRRAPLVAPPRNEWPDYSINAFMLLKQYLEPGFISRSTRRMLGALGFSELSRKLLYHDFEIALDAVHAFSRAHKLLCKRFETLSTETWEALHDPDTPDWHALDPIVLLHVCNEMREASKMADELLAEFLSGDADYMVSVASKHLVRNLLSGMDRAVTSQVHAGNLDENEAGMLYKCVHMCQWRLQMGNMVPNPPSVESLLENIPIFANLEKTTLSSIAHYSEERHLKRDNMLFEEDQSTDSDVSSQAGLYLIVAGSVALYKQRPQVERANSRHVIFPLDDSVTEDDSDLDESKDSIFTKVRRLDGSIGGVVEGFSVLPDSPSQRKGPRKSQKIVRKMTERITKTFSTSVERAYGLRASLGSNQIPTITDLKSLQHPSSTKSGPSSQATKAKARVNRTLSLKERYGRLRGTASTNAVLGLASMLLGGNPLMSARATTMVVCIFIPAHAISSVFRRKFNPFAVNRNLVHCALKDPATMQKHRYTGAMNSLIAGVTSRPPWGKPKGFQMFRVSTLPRIGGLGKGKSELKVAPAVLLPASLSRPRETKNDPEKVQAGRIGDGSKESEQWAQRTGRIAIPEDAQQGGRVKFIEPPPGDLETIVPPGDNLEPIPVLSAEGTKEKPKTKKDRSGTMNIMRKIKKSVLTAKVKYSEPDADEFEERACREAGKYAALILCRDAILRQFEVRPQNLMAQLEHIICERSDFVRSGIGERLHISRPCLLLTGCMKTVSGDGSTKTHSGIAFLRSTKMQREYSTSEDSKGNIVRLLLLDVSTFSGSAVPDHGNVLSHLLHADSPVPREVQAELRAEGYEPPPLVTRTISKDNSGVVPLPRLPDSLRARTRRVSTLMWSALTTASIKSAETKPGTPSNGSSPRAPRSMNAERQRTQRIKNNRLGRRGSIETGAVRNVKR